MKQMRKLTLWFAMALTLILMAGMSVCAESVVLKTPTGIYQDGAGGTAIRVKYEGDYSYLNYEVQISTDKLNWQNVQPTLTANKQALINNLEAGRSYFVRVRAHLQGTEQVSEWTQPYKVSTCPGNVSAAVTQTGKPTATSGTISWGSAVGATGYQIWYSASVLQKQKCIGTTASTSYVLKGLNKDSSHFVTVIPYTDINVGTPNAGAVITNTYSFFISGNDCFVKTLPAKVSELQNYQWKPNSKDLTVVWKEGNVADGYELVFYNDKNKQVKKVSVPYGKYTYNSYKCTKVKKNTYCKVKARAYVTVAGKKYYSAYSKPIYCISEPKMNKQGKFGNGYIEFSWKKVNGATGYDVYISTGSSNSSYKKVASLGKNKTTYSATKFKGASISKYKTYNFYVVAKKKVGGKTYKSVKTSSFSF